MPDMDIVAACTEFYKKIKHVRTLPGPYTVSASTADWRGVLTVDSEGREHLELTVRVPITPEYIEITIEGKTPEVLVGVDDDAHILDHLTSRHGWIRPAPSSALGAGDKEQMHAWHRRAHEDETGKYLDHTHPGMVSNA